jgi:hypothetical protein
MSEWIDDIIDRNFPRLIFICGIAWLFLCLYALYVTYNTVQAVVDLQVMIHTVRDQQDANQRDLKRIIEEEFYLKQRMKEMGR